jgi:leishmanolysin
MSLSGVWVRLLRICISLILIGLIAACSDSTAPAPSSGSTAQFTVTVRFVDPTPPSQPVLTAFNQAIAKWQSVIADSVGSIPVKLAAGACDSAQPALNETVRDLLVLVHVRQIRDTVPGQAILGESGPCLVRKPGNLPILGVMSLNSSTLETLAGNGLLDDVIEHEMAHLLGFGTVWDLDGLLRDTTTSDPWFSGMDAQAAFRQALPSFTDKIVPVEANGGSGTTLSHWRESVMTNELMTGFLNSGPNPLSAVTIESMADLGYSVNVSAADPWPTPSSGASAAAVATPHPSFSITGSPTHTALHRPRFWVTRSGEIGPVSQP